MTSNADESRAVLDETQMAQILGVSLSWIQRDRRHKRLIPFYRMGGFIRYDLARVKAALIKLEEGGIAPKGQRKGGAA